MKKVTGAVGLAALAITTGSADAASTIEPQVSKEKKQEVVQVAAMTAYQRWRLQQWYRRHGIYRPFGEGGLASSSKEPFVKDAHPRGPSWVNKPRGVDDLSNVLTNPAINVNRAYRRNMDR